MEIILIILGYLKWHYSKAISSLTNIWKNFLYFISEFFSIKLLFQNFFDPWKRMSDGYPKSFDLKKYFFAFITNVIVRVVGMIMRSALIIISLICYIFSILLLPIVLVCWLLLPFIIIFLIGTGLFLIFSK